MFFDKKSSKYGVYLVYFDNLRMGKYVPLPQSRERKYLSKTLCRIFAFFFSKQDKVWKNTEILVSLFFHQKDFLKKVSTLHNLSLGL